MRSNAVGFIAVVVILVQAASAQERSVRLAALDFGNSPTADGVVGALIKAISARATAGNDAVHLQIIDRDQARAASQGAGYRGSLNLSLQEARDLGAAIGSDFYLLGNAQTLRRSPSEGPAYFEAFASIFLVSARTGKLVRWERLEFRRPTHAAAEQALLAALATPGTRHRYHLDIHRTLLEEREARIRAVETVTPVIEVLSDDQTETGVRAPRPFRRVKPAYPNAAAQDAVEATVDVLADINEKGDVDHVEITRWAGYGLDESVIGTVKEMHFFPAMRDGRAIPMRVLLRYNFRKPPPQ